MYTVEHATNKKIKQHHGNKGDTMPSNAERKRWQFKWVVRVRWSREIILYIWTIVRCFVLFWVCRSLSLSLSLYSTPKQRLGAYIAFTHEFYCVHEHSSNTKIKRIKKTHVFRWLFGNLLLCMYMYIFFILFFFSFAKEKSLYIFFPSALLCCRLQITDSVTCNKYGTDTLLHYAEWWTTKIR